MVQVNPSSKALWNSHVILNGKGRDYYVGNFPGPLSIKSMVCGLAAWETDEGRFEIGPGSCLVINDGQPYSITVDSKETVETFCVFFAAGYVEDIQRALTHSDAALLREPAKAETVEFHQRFQPNDSLLTALLQSLRATGGENLILRLAEALIFQMAEVGEQAARLPAAKPSTQAELSKRLHRGRNVIEGSLGERLSLEDIARQAALSPYHFHRCFTRLFRETPLDYLSRRRMERASDLLKNTSMLVTEVCLACGYESLGSFSTRFREHTGCSPREFRRGAI